MTVKTNGYSAATPTRYLIDAGAIYTNLTFDEETGVADGELMGATSGGNEFTVVQETRDAEVDGVKGRTKGGTLITSENAELLVNLKELTAQNIQRAIAGGTMDSNSAEGYDIISSKGRIDLDDYIDNVAFVGRLTGSQKPVIIVLDNAISLEGLKITTADEAEAVVPIRFGAHYDADNTDLGSAPYRIYWPKETGGSN
ncbi:MULTISPECIES: hypothetical protein [Alkalihalophilus]|uniref:Phage tail protein n=1 Tax=Alkalihalophilus pseudofirmus TaxID=79885 RepID=A0AAJ2NK53_ALKPS|nr:MULTISPECIES: hypothetical protein [Alkalihalophilus]MDV2883836.1 hypothetical protein [Alkalihalophilus pseudofirmus]MEC2070341.1 hypothetical protein [Alkalihalophilus marmarensis]OLS34454.1 hypothetical protein BTR22_18660 [Alkalihalophilus pseudofirmus]